METPKRVCIENVNPEIDCGTVTVKRVVNEPMKVSADIFTDGHDEVDGLLLFREEKKKGKPRKWKQSPMKFEGNDRWSAEIQFANTGNYEYSLEAWIDHFTTWQHDLKKKHQAHQPLETELLIGVGMLEEAISRANAAQRKRLQSAIKKLKNTKDSEAVNWALSDELSTLMYQNRNRDKAFQYENILPLQVERKRALFSAWYELFPRSTAKNPGTHGTFKDCERLLPEIAKMGFDVIYLPPIHPIGTSHRKGRNNATEPQANDPGSPWAIGSEEGGHKAIHSQLGSMADFEQLVQKAADLGIEIALDFAIQCSPDHPYVKKHPQWFKWRPDGTVQYAENPPKKYQDVLPVNFETEDWENLWAELKSIVDFWIEKGVNIFRVDNPHTKPFVFWKWLIQGIHQQHPDILFLAEAFTRPRVMEELAKVGFTQSYTYFTWRNSKEEFMEYLQELTQTDLREYFRPNFWPNTPDILPISLENQPENAFLIRLILAGTLSSNYGIYGPLFEFGENEAFPGKEEYNHSEKYEIKNWDWLKQTKIKAVISKLNQVRKENPALQETANISFNEIDNPQLLSYTKTQMQEGNHILVVVNLDSEKAQSGWVKVPLADLNIKENQAYRAHDVLNDQQYNWVNAWNYIELHPQEFPAHIFRIEKIES